MNSRALTVLPLTVATLVLAGSVSVRAQVIAHEDFNYPTGTQVAGVNGGTGWATPWSSASTSIATNLASSLTYDGVVTSGGAVLMGYPGGWPASGGQTANAQRLLPDTLGNLAAAGSGSILVSFLYQNLNTDMAGLLGFREAKLAFFSGATTNASGNANVNGSERLDVGSPNTYAAGASDTLSLFQGSTFISSGIATPRGADPANTVFVLMRIDVDNTSAADTAYAWFDPSLGSEPSTSTAISFTANDLSGVNAVRLQGGNLNSSGTNAVFVADELRLGYSYSDVSPVPEPTVLALAGLGLLAAFFKLSTWRRS